MLKLFFASTKEFLSSRLVIDALLLRYFLVSDITWLWGYHELLLWTFDMLLTYGDAGIYYTVRSLIVIAGAMGTLFMAYGHFKGAIDWGKRSARFTTFRRVYAVRYAGVPREKSTPHRLLCLHILSPIDLSRLLRHCYGCVV